MGNKYFRGSATGPGATFSLCEAIRTGFIDAQVGWTLFDNVSSTPGSSKRIFKSPVSAIGTFYVEISEISTTVVRLRSWSDWDPVTHTGAHGTADFCSVVGQDATFVYELCFDSNGLVVCPHTTFDSPAFTGLLDNSSTVPPHMAGIATLGSDIIASATSFPTTASMVGKIFIGQDLIILGLTSVSGDARFNLRERVKVTAVSASALTVTATANAYKAGSIAGFDPLPLCATYQINAAGLRTAINSSQVSGGGNILFSYYLIGATGVGSGSGIVWSYLFDFQGTSNSWGKAYRLGNLPAYEIGRLWAIDMQQPGYEANRGRFPPIVGHVKSDTQVLTDRFQVGTDSWFRVTSAIGAGGTGWGNVALVFGPRPSAEIANIGGTDFQGAFALDISGGGGGGGGGVAPTVSVITPTPGSVIPSARIIGPLTISGPAPFGKVILLASFPSLNLYEVVHDGITFGPNYTNVNNTMTGGGSSFTFNIGRDGGWPASFAIVPHAFDSNGNQVAFNPITFALTGTPGQLPAVSGVNLIPGGAALPQVVKIIANVPAGNNNSILHGLVRAPTLHVLCLGTDSNVKRSNLAPNITSCIYNNAAVASKPVVALAIAPHSIVIDRVVQLTGPTSTVGVQTVPHGLPAKPDIIFVEAGTDALISGNTISADTVNITFGAGGNASGLVYGFLAVALDSEWSVGQWANLVTGGNKPGGGTYGTVGAGGVNVAVPHGLLRTPSVVVLGARSGAGLTLGTTNPDAVNIYLSNPGGAPVNFEALTLCGHSVIA